MVTKEELVQAVKDKNTGLILGSLLEARGKFLSGDDSAKKLIGNSLSGMAEALDNPDSKESLPTRLALEFLNRVFPKQMEGGSFYTESLFKVTANSISIGAVIPEFARQVEVSFAQRGDIKEAFRAPAFSLLLMAKSGVDEAKSIVEAGLNYKPEEVSSEFEADSASRYSGHHAQISR